MQEHVVEEDAGHHGFADGHRMDADAGVVVAFGDGFAGGQDGVVGFTAKLTTTTCPVLMAPNDGHI